MNPLPLPAASRRTLPVLAALLLGITAGGLPAFGAAEPPPKEAPGITGQITSIPEGGKAVLVEEKPGERSGSSKAMVRITPATRLLGLDGEALPEGSLRVGQRVRVWFKGPVAESYPARATGAVIQLVP